MNTNDRDAIIVTGGAKRLGRVICHVLADAGFEIIIHANNSIKDAESLAQEIIDKGVYASIIIGDLNDETFLHDLIPQAQRLAKGKVCGLINNASIFENDDADEFSINDLNLHLGVNAIAPMVLTQSLYKMLDGTQGFVVNIIDQRVFKLNPKFFTYTLSKSLLATATKTMAQAFAPNLRINGVAPGPSMANSRQSLDDFAAQCDATLLKTGSPPDAIAQAIVFLAKAKNVTGQILAVDGGQSLIWQTPDIIGINE